uniref:phospholipid transfer protein C2CD2L-like isoform X2 n=1 Tax=Myxine glutinosa TaxID=7769 RepID=UPI00358F01BF
MAFGPPSPWDVRGLILLVMFISSLVTVIAWLVRFVSLRSRRRNCSQSLTVAELLVKLTESVGGHEEAARGAWLEALNGPNKAAVAAHGVHFDDINLTQVPLQLNGVTCEDCSDSTLSLRAHATAPSLSFRFSHSSNSTSSSNPTLYHGKLTPLHLQGVLRGLTDKQRGLHLTWSVTDDPSMQIFLTTPDPSQDDLQMLRTQIRKLFLFAVPTLTLNLSFTPKILDKIVAPTPPKPPRLLSQHLRVSGGVSEWPEGADALHCLLRMDEPAQQHLVPIGPVQARNGSLGGSDAEHRWDPVSFELNTKSSALTCSLLDCSRGSDVILRRKTVRLDPGKGKQCERLCLSLEDLQNPAGQKCHKIFVELAYIDKPGDTKGVNAHGSTSTPSKRVQLERSVLPDGTLLTTVTTRHSRMRGNAPCVRSPIKVMVTETEGTMAGAVGTSCGSQEPQANGCESLLVARRGPGTVAELAMQSLVSAPRPSTPTRRSMLLISGIERVPLVQDDVALSHLYALSMEEYKGEPAAPNAPGTPPSTDPPDSPQATQSSPGSPSLSKSPPATPPAASESTSRTNGEMERNVSPMLPHPVCPNSDTVPDEESVRAVDTQSLKERRGTFRMSTLLRRRNRTPTQSPGLSRSQEHLHTIQRLNRTPLSLSRFIHRLRPRSANGQSASASSSPGSIPRNGVAVSTPAQ